MKTDRQKIKPKQSVRSLKAKVWEIFSKYIRTRDCVYTTGCSSFGFCFTCGKRYHLKLLQAGHFIPGRHNANLFSEKGTHAQCYNCNINLKGNTLEYRRKIIWLYGEDYDEILEDEAKQAKKFTVSELEELLEHYKEKLKEVE